MIEFVDFPDVSTANEDGVIAMGGDLSLDTLVSAYSQGIFPWFNQEQPILWWSPDPRLVLYPSKINVSRSLKKVIRNKRYHLTCNTAFERVIKGCALRGNENIQTAKDETWITESMHSAYVSLHKHNYAHSIEVWLDDELVGGLYGVALGNVFFGESMFSTATDASKTALVGLSCWLNEKNFELIDCQVASDHLFSMGAEEISRDVFLQPLKNIDINAPLKNFSHEFENLDLENAINKL